MTDPRKPINDIDSLVISIFDPFPTWVPTVQDNGIGPFDKERVDRFHNDIVATMDHAREVLEGKGQNVLAAAFTGLEPGAPSSRNLSQWKEIFKEQREWLRKNEPKWFHIGLGNPHAKADFSYWKLMPRLSVDEALHLSVGLEPNTFKSDDLDTFPSLIRGLLPLEFLTKRRELLRRVFDPFRQSDSFSFTDFQKWITDSGLACPPELQVTLSKQSSGSTSPIHSPAKEPKAPDRREIDKIAQLFTAMAMDHLGYQPTARKSPTAKEVSDIAASYGLSISDDTVRKYLKLVASFPPDDWKA